MITNDANNSTTHPDATQVSVVIPLYNARHTVRRAVQSVLDQTHTSFQLIIVDDGSTDHSAQQLQDINDKRITIIRQPNAGVSAARNRGITQATHPLIAFLDADDLWLPNHLADIVNLHRQNPSAQAYATAYSIQPQNQPQRPVQLAKLPQNFQGPLNDYFKLATHSEPPVCSSTVAATKSALLAIGQFPLGVGQGEDLLTWARLACHTTIAYNAQPSAIIHPPHTTDDTPIRIPPKRDTVGQQLQASLQSAPSSLRPSLKKYIAHWHKMRANMFVRLNNKPAARRELAKALPRNPLNLRLWAWVALACLPQFITRRALQKINSRRQLQSNQPRLAILTNLLAPYRIPVYNALAQNFDTSLILSGAEPNRATWQNLGHQLPNINIQHTRGAKITKRNTDNKKLIDLRWIHINPGYLTRLVRQQPAAVISAEMGFRTLCALAYCATFRKPLWVWWGGTKHTERNASLLRRILRFAITRSSARFITYGQSATEYLQHLNVNTSRILQIQNCIDEQAFLCNTTSRNQTIATPIKTPQILCVGHLVPGKGQRQLIESAARLKKRGHVFSLNLVGAGPDEHALKSLVAELSLTNVTFTPPLKPHDMPAVYQAAQALIFPTLQDAWGLVVNEALWSNLPVASSIYAGCTTEIVPQSNHFDPLIPDQIDRALTAAIQGRLKPHNPANLLTADQVAQRIIDQINTVISPDLITLTTPPTQARNTFNKAA